MKIYIGDKLNYVLILKMEHPWDKLIQVLYLMKSLWS